LEDLGSLPHVLNNYLNDTQKYSSNYHWFLIP
jgi:hypothetical protein